MLLPPLTNEDFIIKKLTWLTAEAENFYPLLTDVNVQSKDSALQLQDPVDHVNICWQ